MSAFARLVRAWASAGVVFSAFGFGAFAAATNSLTVTLLPAAPGPQIFRASLPFPKGVLGERGGLTLQAGGLKINAAVRTLTVYPTEPGKPKSVRRALVSFPFTFEGTHPVTLRLLPTAAGEQSGSPRTRVAMKGDELEINCLGGPVITAKLIGPARKSKVPSRVETVEETPYFLWQRFHYPDPEWPRVLEVRTDSAGTVAIIAHLQNLEPGNIRAPDFGWEVSSHTVADEVETPEGRRQSPDQAFVQQLRNQDPPAVVFAGRRYRIYHPVAGLKRRGVCEWQPGSGGFTYNYRRATADEKVPMQQAAWQRAELVIAPVGQARLTPTLQYAHEFRVDWLVWDELYKTGTPLEFKEQPLLQEVAAYHRQAIRRSMVLGDDMGNVTMFSDTRLSGGVYGMNRLNHCPPIFEEAYRAGDRKLLETALLWCENFVDQSIWWGPGQTGGTRYNNIIAQNKPLPDNDRSYMWRSDDSVHFCTKGYDSFFIAYEDTGDPRMKESLEAQLQYALEQIRATAETRNVGDARDFVRLHRFTGDPQYLKAAQRLFEDYRSRLSTGNLTSQGGQPIEANPPFIDEDAVGMKHPFAKPYIIGYALTGLPELLPFEPEEPKLREVVRATADFLAESSDPLGGWRYPHPRSSQLLLAQAMEHAWHIVQADSVLGPDEKHLDVIERVLRQRILGFQATGRILSGLDAWELATGKVKQHADLYALYRYPADRDFHRDYVHGFIGLGDSPPEGLVYFFDVLRYYLEHRNVQELLRPARSDEPLAVVLERAPRKPAPASALQNPPAPAPAPSAEFQSPGVINDLPGFRQAALDRLTFPLSWTSGTFSDFDRWRRLARAKVAECLLPAPPTRPFEPRISAEEDRGSYMARKLVFNLNADSRVLALMTIPKGTGPFPAVLLLHDHGAKFDIGKEKVIRPWADTAAKLKSAEEWVQKYYGGRFLGDELAQRGYVCLATDMLNWSDRGGGGYEGQQALAANLLQLGSSFAGVIAHEDLRAAEFLATRPEVDSRRVAAMGLSVGGFRTWQLAALSDRIAAGVSVCWMATLKSLMVPKNNQTRGQSAFTMIHPGLDNSMDYADVASIACPKPLMFLCGSQDKLFPTPGIQDAFAKMRSVWNSQSAGAQLETRLYDAPHEYNRQMQDEAFAWLDRQFKPKQ
jgi:dienelactone hydrolase